MTTKAQIIAAIEASADETVRVISNEADRAEGTAFLDAADRLTVSWDDGSRTPLFAAAVELA